MNDATFPPSKGGHGHLRLPDTAPHFSSIISHCSLVTDLFTSYPTPSPSIPLHSQPEEVALGGLDLKMAKLSADNCGPCEFVILSATSEKSREYFCKTDTPDNRTLWGGVIQSVINRLIEGRATFHGKPFFQPISPESRSSAPENSTSSTMTPHEYPPSQSSAPLASSSPAITNNSISGNSGVSSPSSPYAAPSMTQPTSSYQDGSNAPQPTAASPQVAALRTGGDTIGATPSSSSSPALGPQARASVNVTMNVFGTAGPLVQFNPLGGQEIVRVFLPDFSSKTLLFDTTQSVDALSQQILKKVGGSGSAFDNYAIFAFTLGESRLLPRTATLVSQVSSWPTKNDPEHYRLEFQPEQEMDRKRASAVGFLEVRTNANSHANPHKSTSFVSQVMGAVRSKQEWTGNLTLSALPTPFLHRGNFIKKASGLAASKDLVGVVTSSALYWFDSPAQPQDKSKGWLPLEKSALYKERSPLSFVLYYILPGTLDVSKSLEVTLKTDEEKKTWIAVLEPRCKGTIPAKAKPHRRAASSTNVRSDRSNGNTDVGAMLKATPTGSPKLTHPTAARPKGAGKRPPTTRPGAGLSSPTFDSSPSSPPQNYAATGSGDFYGPNSSSSPNLGATTPAYTGSSSNPALASNSNPYTAGSFATNESPRTNLNGSGSAPGSTVTASTSTPGSTPGSLPPNGGGLYSAPPGSSPRMPLPASPRPGVPPPNGNFAPINTPNSAGFQSGFSNAGGQQNNSSPNLGYNAGYGAPAGGNNAQAPGTLQQGANGGGAYPYNANGNGAYAPNANGGSAYTPNTLGGGAYSPNTTAGSAYTAGGTAYTPNTNGGAAYTPNTSGGGVYSPGGAAYTPNAAGGGSYPLNTSGGGAYSPSAPGGMNNPNGGVSPGFSSPRPAGSPPKMPATGVGFSSTTNTSPRPNNNPPMSATGAPQPNTGLPSPRPLVSPPSAPTTVVIAPNTTTTPTTTTTTTYGATPMPNRPPVPITGPVLTGPNPGTFNNQFATAPAGGARPPASVSPTPSSPGPYYAGQQFSNPALNLGTAPASQKPVSEQDSDVVDIKALLGLGSPAIPKQQQFPAYQSPHISSGPLAPAKGSNVMYSPVLAKPMPLQNTTPPAVDNTPKTPFNSGAATTISIAPNNTAPQLYQQPPPQQQQQQQQQTPASPFSAVPTNNAVATPPVANTSPTTVKLVEAPTPSIIMDILSSPMAPIDANSPFDDIPFD